MKEVWACRSDTGGVGPGLLMCHICSYVMLAAVHYSGTRSKVVLLQVVCCYIVLIYQWKPATVTFDWRGMHTLEAFQLASLSSHAANVQSTQA